MPGTRRLYLHSILLAGLAALAAFVLSVLGWSGHRPVAPAFAQGVDASLAQALAPELEDVKVLTLADLSEVQRRMIPIVRISSFDWKVTSTPTTSRN